METPQTPAPKSASKQPTAPSSEHIDSRKLYSVFAAVTDAYSAALQNAKNFFGAIGVSYAIVILSAYALSFALALLAVGGVASIMSITTGGGTSALPSVFLFSIPLIVLLFLAWSVLSGALLTATAATTIEDGAAKRQRTFGETFATIRGRILRAAGASVLFTLALGAPILLPFIPAIFMAFSGNSNVVMFIPFLMIAAIIAMYILYVRFALVPYVAMFEPKLALTKTFARSRELLQDGGQWFLVKGFLALFAIAILFGIVSGSSAQNPSVADMVLSNIFAVLLTLLMQGALIMLYRNRAGLQK